MTLITVDYFKSFLNRTEYQYKTDSFFGGKKVLVKGAVAVPFDELKRFFLSIKKELSKEEIVRYGQKIFAMDKESSEKLSCISSFFEGMRNLFKCLGAIFKTPIQEKFLDAIIKAGTRELPTLQHGPYRRADNNYRG